MFAFVEVLVWGLWAVRRIFDGLAWVAELLTVLVGR